MIVVAPRFQSTTMMFMSSSESRRCTRSGIQTGAEPVGRYPWIMKVVFLVRLRYLEAVKLSSSAQSSFCLVYSISFTSRSVPIKALPKLSTVNAGHVSLGSEMSTEWHSSGLAAKRFSWPFLPASPAQAQNVCWELPGLLLSLPLCLSLLCILVFLAVLEQRQRVHQHSPVCCMPSTSSWEVAWALQKP